MINQLLNRNKDLALVIGMIVILAVLFAPIPPVVLDMAIIVNFGLALTILLLTFYVRQPTDFSTFPSLLLLATLFRLAMNIAATRLILSTGGAGEVIGSIGAFAVSGNFIVGLVVFSILVVVQFVVVTSGAQRVSEVAARFTLDSMPGQQMSIDADLNMGLIDQREALRRREELEKEASFYGAMDGASKFIKGDAVAGVIILLINIIAGWAIGVTQMDLSWKESLERFSLLTVGDGIATQMPALIIAVATGIIVTRSTADRDLGIEIFRQLSSFPRVLVIVAGLLCILLLLPGMPKWPLLLIGPGGLALAFQLRKRSKAGAVDDPEGAAGEPDGLVAPADVQIALGRDLSAQWGGEEPAIMKRLKEMREAQRRDLGVGFPAVTVGPDSLLAATEYEIRIFGARHAGAELSPGRLLAIKGEASNKITGDETIDPAFGLPALWIEPEAAEAARAEGYSIIDPLTVLMTHVGEVMRQEAASMLTRSAVSRLLEEARKIEPGLVEELTPNVMPLSDLQRVLQNLLAEHVSIENIILILEHLVDIARHEKDVNKLTEILRQRMSNLICSRLRARHRDLAVLSLDPRLENQLAAGAANVPPGREQLMVDPKIAEQVIKKLIVLSWDMSRQGRTPTLLCGSEIRRPLRALTQRSVPKLAVISVNEIPRNIELSSFGVVRLESAT